MAAPTNVPGVQAQGNIKLQFSPAGDLLAPSLADVTAVGSLDVSCYFFNWAPTAETNKVTPPRRVCSKRQLQKDGTTTEGIPDLNYVVDPQAATGADAKKAFETLVDGTDGYIYERFGIDVDIDWAVGQFVVVRHVVFGFQHINGDPSDEANEFQVTQSVSLQEPGSSALLPLVA